MLSTHDLDLAIQMADCLWLLAKDKPMVAGSPEDLILQGAFTSFFDRGMIHFDSLTGKLNLVQKNQPVLVRGESNLVYWLGNALKRNGFDPMENGHADIEITAQTSSCMFLYQVGREPQTFTSVASLIRFFLFSVERRTPLTGRKVLPSDQPNVSIRNPKRYLCFAW